LYSGKSCGFLGVLEQMCIRFELLMEKKKIIKCWWWWHFFDIISYNRTKAIISPFFVPLFTYYMPLILPNTLKHSCPTIMNLKLFMERKEINIKVGLWQVFWKLDIDIVYVTFAFSWTIFIYIFPSMLPFFSHYKPLISIISLPLPVKMELIDEVLRCWWMDCMCFCVNNRANRLILFW